MKRLLSVMAMFFMAAAVAFPLAAHATPTLWLSDGVTTIQVADQQVGGDSNPIVGAVTYLGAVGTNWWLNVSSGITTPALGSQSEPSMDLNSVDINSVYGVGNLTLMFSEIDFTPSGVHNTAMSIGGTTIGAVTYSAYFDNTNGLLTTPPGGLIGTLGPYPSSGFAGSPPLGFGGDLTNNITTSNPFSLTQVVTITHQAVGTSSFNAALDFVPVPASVLLLGSGLVGLGLLGWRRRQVR